MAIFVLGLASVGKMVPLWKKMRPDLSVSSLSIRLLSVSETIGNTCFMFQQLADGRMVQAHEEPITFEAENDGPHQVHNSQDLRREKF